MKKILLGGSPCTYWSIAQKNNRETEAEGLGWELFKNYLIAKEKFKPDFFLYENNKSAAQAIKDQIKKELNVWDGTLFSEDSGARYIEINSALVSAQNRQRFYVHNCGDVEQPKDRGIVLRDILESGVVDKEKAYCLKHQQGNARDYFKKHHTQIAFEPTRVPDYGITDKSRPVTACYANKGCGEGSLLSEAFPDNPNKQVRDYVAEPIRIGDIGSNAQAHRVYSCDGKSVTLSANGGGQGGKTGLYTTPIKVGEVGNGGQGNRVYSVDGKAVAQTAGSGVLGSNTGLYAYPVVEDNVLSDEYYHGGFDGSLIGMVETPMKGRNGKQPSQHCRVYSCDDKSPQIYEVENGLITIKGKQYPIKLADGCYIIRKLTPIECERLQTLPDGYTKAVSNTQRYKGLGNGWTAEVIIHILNGALKDVPKDEEIVVLSMYDGIGTGRYCLDKMGFTNVKYYAYEIDKYAKQVSMSNYPDIIQCGDAFDIRHPDWTIGY